MTEKVGKEVDNPQAVSPCPAMGQPGTTSRRKTRRVTLLETPSNSQRYPRSMLRQRHPGTSKEAESS